MHHGRPYPFLAMLPFSLLFSASVFASENPSYTQWGHAITVQPNEEVGDLTCFGCTIHVRGQVAGDVTTFGGSVTIEDQGQVSGDVTVFGGNLRLAKTVKVDGDATVFGGQLRRDPEATVGGDVTSMGGRGWLVLIFLVPLVFLGLLVAGVIWLIQRLTRPSVPAAV